MNNLADAFDRAGWTCWQRRDYSRAMQLWATYLNLLADDRRAWYGIYA